MKIAGGPFFLICLQFCVIIVLILYDTHILEYLKRSRQRKTQPLKSKTDAVILFTKMKSGSTIVGSIFNKQKGVTYLYEPLYPFGETPCLQSIDERLKVLQAISGCQFEKLAPLYSKTNRPDKIAKCRRHNLCFADGKHSFSEFLSRDTKICNESSDSWQSCPVPINSQALNKHCKSSILVAMKVIYLCKLKWLIPLLNQSSLNIKVIHLVRDPRATIFSRVGRKSKIRQVITRSADLLCNNLVENIKFADSELNNTSLADRYMRIRFEEFVFRPVEVTRKIFNFVGIDLTNEVTTWLESSVIESNEFEIPQEYHQAHMRRPDSVTLWRRRLSFEFVQEIQKRCLPIFKILGYKLYLNESKYRMLSKVFFISDSDIVTDLKK